MTAPSTDTHSSMDACPPLEDIAAFLDGRLPPEERARITEHLARCESCYEIFAGAVHFQEEEEASSAEDIDGGDVLPFPLAEEKTQEKHVRAEPARPPRRVSRWLPLAASVVLATGLGYMIWQSSRVLPELTVAGLTEPLHGQPGLAQHLYQPEDVPRGDDDRAGSLFSDSSAFLVGVYLLDLQLSVNAEDVERAQTALYDLQTELGQTSLPQNLVKRFKEEADRMTSLPALQAFASTLPQRESELQSWFAEDPFFRFGLWTEASRLAAKARSPELFEQRLNRRFLSAIQREIPSEDELYRPILDDLRKIEPLWDRDKRGPEDYEALARHFKSIIDQMERVQKEEQEEPYPSPD